MKIAGTNKSEKERAVFIGFDEVKAEEKLEYDKTHDTLVGPHKQVQVVQIRALFEDYKQVVFSDFDVPVTKMLLDEISISLHDIGYHVVGIVSDLGAPNQKLHKELEVSPAKPYYFHPSTGEKIFVFACSPHMLKLFRNHFIDFGFGLVDGNIVNKNIVTKLYQFCSKQRKEGELSSMFHLTSNHLTVDSTARQHVRTAAELLSQKTVTGLRKYALHLSDGDDAKIEEALRVANVIETVSFIFNKYFELKIKNIKQIRSHFYRGVNSDIIKY